MIMLALIVNVIFVFLAMWFIATMGEGDRTKDGDQNDSVRRLTNHGAPDEKTKTKQDAI